MKDRIIFHISFDIFHLVIDGRRSVLRSQQLRPQALTDSSHNGRLNLSNAQMKNDK